MNHTFEKYYKKYIHSQMRCRLHITNKELKTLNKKSINRLAFGYKVQNYWYYSNEKEWTVYINKSSHNFKVRPNLNLCSASATKQNWGKWPFPKLGCSKQLWCFESDILILGKHSTNCCSILKRKYFYIVKIAHFNLRIIAISKKMWCDPFFFNQSCLCTLRYFFGFFL